MSEWEILKILPQKNNSTNNESFNIKNVKTFAENVTDLIYESLQNKSSSSNIKRGNLLVNLYLLWNITLQ